jgi:recombinational DNA repair ATPase RecF
MNIIEMNITNVKRIVAVHIEPETGDHVVLTGDNGQGKSSILDAVYLALTNKGLEDPIRHGTSRASIKLHIDGAEGNFWIERNISRKSNTLRVYPENGEDIKAPQRFLDGLIGTLAFDPLEFMRMDAEHQAEMIRRLVGIDTTAIDQEYATLYAQRRRS